MVYENCQIYGPYESSTDNRLRMQIILPNGKRRWVSYPKYLMEIKLNRYLCKDEEVHHVDEDINNNDYTNLEILTQVEHKKLHDSFKKVEPEEFMCKYCKKKFIAEGKRLYNIKFMISRYLNYKPCCSRSCGSRH